MKFGKLFSLAVGAVMAFSLLTACGEPSTGGPGDQGGDEIDINVDPNITATLKIAVKNSQEEIGIIDSVAAVFNKEFPNVTVKAEPFTGETYSYMMQVIRKPDAPDAIISTSFEMFQMMNSAVILNLQPYIDAETKAGTFDINEYYPTFIRAGQENFNGDQYLIPRSADRVVCHYNVAIVNRANEWYKTSPLYDAEVCENLNDLIKNGWTWDDFKFVCSVIRAYYDTDPNLKDRYLLDSEFNWEAVWNPILDSYGVEFIDENKNILIDSQNTRDALEFMKDFVTKRYTSNVSANFYSGRGVFFFHSQSAKNVAEKIGENNAYLNGSSGDTYKELCEQGRYSEYYNCVSMPVKPGAERIGAGNAGYCVSIKSQQPVLAWKFLKTMLTQEGQNAMSKDSKLNYVPVRKDMADATKWEWGKGLDGINLDAFTYMSGQDGEEDWNCFTDFFLVKPTQASNLIGDVQTMVSSYVFDAASPTIDKVIANCVSSMTGRMKQR